MRWTKYENDIIRRNWQFCSDKVLAAKLGTTQDAVGAQRKALGIYRRPPAGFVVQVTNWLEKIEDLDSCTELLRRDNIEYVIATCGNGYALFRQYAGAMNVVAAPPEHTWVIHWVPPE
jgi:hypothetical protein